MKTFTALVSIAAFIAFVPFQFSFEMALSIFFVAGVAAFVVRDYFRPMRSLVLAPAMQTAALRRQERLGLAA